MKFQAVISRGAHLFIIGYHAHSLIREFFLALWGAGVRGCRKCVASEAI